MREQVTGHMPMLSHLFHLAPDDIWNLNHHELNVYLEAADDYAKAQQ